MLVKCAAVQKSCVVPSVRVRRTPVVVKCIAQPSRREPAARKSSSTTTYTPLLSAGGLIAPYLYAADALATNGDFGILEGRSAALVHPIVMGVLLGASLYGGWLGFQWRRTRTIGDDIKALKAQLPKVKVPVTPGGEAAAPEPEPSPLQQQITALEKERKELVQAGYRDRHNNVGSWLLGAGVLIGVEGTVNTWMRTGKLFPGPHLFAGATIVVLWALAAALVPAMQKGNNTARNTHIALNLANIGLFLWQVPTGLEIVAKLFEFTKWP
eukprot:GHRR01001936.1.p1 GENE.GHRR01001936.1~~GHRR01001936.1.p1  ORF type:complete len:269 (+),score=77.40 GHRR01001936.1:199-1005(+)